TVATVGFEYCATDQLLDPSATAGGYSAPPWLPADLLYGIISFDNMGLALLAVFQIITLENWSSIMYMLQDAYSWWFASAFFVILVLVGGLFTVNLMVSE
ncbi:unnamed protein product, partial [Chrysoparadoxa australica]